jgi:hypothetical protein
VSRRFHAKRRAYDSATFHVFDGEHAFIPVACNELDAERVRSALELVFGPEPVEADPAFILAGRDVLDHDGAEVCTIHPDYDADVVVRALNASVRLTQAKLGEL